jgi:hypothetical protein
MPELQTIQVTRTERYAVLALALAGINGIALLVIWIAGRLIESPIDYDNVIGFFTAWLVAFPLFSIAARLRRKQEAFGKHLLRGLGGAMVGFVVAVLFSRLWP